jgi:hypothetical protein
MDVIARPRRAGKTHEMVQRLIAEPDAILIVHCAEEARRLEHVHPELSGRVVSAQAASSGYTRGRRRGSVYVDNADIVLASLLHVDRVDLVTTTGMAW